MSDIPRVSSVRKTHARGVPYEQVLEERLQDPEFARVYAEMEPEFAIIRQLIARRNELIEIRIIY